MQGLTSLEGAILAFRDRLPDEILVEVMHLVRPYSEFPLKGSLIWPYDNISAKTIDQIVGCVLIHSDFDEAVSATEEIEYDAFVALLTHLYEHYPEECFAYLSTIVRQHHEMDVRFNAAQFLFDNYEVSPSDYIRFVTRLDPDGLSALYSSEIAAFVEEELYCNTPEYAICQSLDILSSATRIGYIQILDLKFSPVGEEKRIDFGGHMYIKADLFFEGEKMGSEGIHGSFSGFFDAHGMHLEEAAADPG